MELEARGDEGWGPIISERTAHRTAIAAHDLGFRVRARFQLAFNGAHPADPLFQFLLGVAVGLIDGLGSFADVVKVAQLVGDIWQGFGDSTAERGVAIGDNAHNGHTQRLSYRVNQVCQVVLRGGQQTTSQENLGGETIAQNPQHLMPHIRLQAIQGQDDAALGVSNLLKTEWVSQRERHKCIVAFQEMLHGAGSKAYPAAPSLLMNLWETTVVGIAQ
jgi:hypothetical protein